MYNGQFSRILPNAIFSIKTRKYGITLLYVTKTIHTFDKKSGFTSLVYGEISPPEFKKGDKKNLILSFNYPITDEIRKECEKLEAEIIFAEPEDIITCRY